MTKELDQKLSELKQLEVGIKELTEAKDKARTEVLSILQAEKINQYKNDIATISVAERKTVKYLIDEGLLIKQLPAQYVDTIPEHQEINNKLEKDVKNGLKVEGVELEVKENIVIRLN